MNFLSLSLKKLQVHLIFLDMTVLFWNPVLILSIMNHEEREYTTRIYLMSPCECCVSVHIIFWLADIDHLVGVELEHALHLQFTSAILWLVWGALGHSLLLQLLPSSLTFPYPSQIPESQKRLTTMNNRDWVKRDYFTHQTSHLQRKWAQMSKI